MAPAAPDKIQEYFASMNSLSARISSDIRVIEENISKGKDAGGVGEEESKLTYNEKCAAIDKYLIDDVVEKNTKIRLDIGAQLPQISRKNNASSTNHLQSLIQAVTPPKPEKYVFEEAGGVWLDEHSGPFSFCKQSQVKCCALGKNVLQNLAETEPADVVRRHHSTKNHEKKRQKPDMKNKVPPGASESRRNSQEVTELIQPRRSAAGRGIFGVNIMDFAGTGTGQVKSTKLANIKSQEKRDDDDDEELQKEMEDKLPQQKQNLQLIAELQAKLKRSNPVQDNSAKMPEPEAEAGKKKPEKSQVSQASTEKSSASSVAKKNSVEDKKGKAKSKVKKPKAPPPPPPPKATPKLDSSPSSSLPREGTEGKSSSSSLGRHKKAVTEQLRNVIAGVKSFTNAHSRKKSNPPTPASTSTALADVPEKATKSVSVTEEPGTSKAAMQKQVPPKPAVPRSRSQSKGDEKDGYVRHGGKASKAEGGPEFFVDVSSPCKIATPKTGLDFLDNW